MAVVTTVREWLANPSVAGVAATVVAFVVVGLLIVREDRVLTREGGVGIVGFALARTPRKSAVIIEGWGDRGGVAATWSLLLDYVLLVAYTALLIMACFSIEAVMAERSSAVALVVASLAPRAALASVIAGIADAIENTALLWQLETQPSNLKVVVASRCAQLKFALIALVVTFCVVGFAFSLMLR